MRKLLRDEVRQIVAGSFEIDGAPTIFKHDRSSTLVFMHEQTHRDNLNNTLFGYWLRRLHHFEDAPAWPALTPPLQVAEEAITGAWNTLEGAAVFTEYLHIHMGYVDVSEKDWLASLPRDYLLAFSVYYRALEWFLKHGAILKSGPPPRPEILFQTIWTMAHAIAECVLDGALLQLAAPPGRFEDLHGIFAGRKADAALPGYLRAASRLTPRQIFAHTNHPEWRQEGPEIGVQIRTLVMGGKRALLNIMGRRSAGLKRFFSPRGRRTALPPMLSDVQRLSKMVEIDTALHSAFPELRPLYFLAHCQGPALICDFAALEPKREFSKVSIDACLVLEHVAAAQQRAGAFGTVIMSERHPSGSLYVGSIIQISQSSGALFVETELLEFEATVSLLLEFDRQFLGCDFFWFGLLLLSPNYPNSIKPHDWDFFRALQAPVYLYASAFDATWLTQLITFLGDEVTLTATALPADTATLQALCLGYANIRIFWIVSGVIDKRSQQARQVGLGQHLFRLVDESESEKHLLTAAYMVRSGFGKQQ